MVVAPGGSPAFLAPLPVAWLQHVGETEPELVGLLARMGLARLGDLAALPAGDVLARFGPPGRHAHRLANGVDERPSGGAEPQPERRVEQTFDDPVAQLDPLVFAGQAPRRPARRRPRRRGSGVHPTRRDGRDRARRAHRPGVVPGGRDVGAGDGRPGALAARRVDDVGGGVGRCRAAAPGARRGARRRRRPGPAVGRAVGGRRAGGARRRPAGRDGGGPGRARAGVARRAPPGGPLRLGAGVDDRSHRRRRHRPSGCGRVRWTAATAATAGGPGAGRTVAGVAAGTVAGRRDGRGAARRAARCRRPGRRRQRPR